MLCRCEGGEGDEDGGGRVIRLVIVVSRSFAPFCAPSWGGIIMNLRLLLDSGLVTQVR